MKTFFFYSDELQRVDGLKASAGQVDKARDDWSLEQCPAPAFPEQCPQNHDVYGRISSTDRMPTQVSAYYEAGQKHFSTVVSSSVLQLLFHTNENKNSFFN